MEILLRFVALLSELHRGLRCEVSRRRRPPLPAQVPTRTGPGVWNAMQPRLGTSDRFPERLTSGGLSPRWPRYINHFLMFITVSSTFY